MVIYYYNYYQSLFNQEKNPIEIKILFFKEVLTKKQQKLQLLKLHRWNYQHSYEKHLQYMEADSSALSLDFKTLQEVKWVHFHSFCNVFHAAGAEKQNTFFPVLCKRTEHKKITSRQLANFKMQQFSVRLNYKCRWATIQARYG